MANAPVAVVTGGSAGVGRAVVRALAGRGFDVAVLARGRAGLDGAVKDVEASGGRALALPTDVARWDEVTAAAERTEQDLGFISVWVNNAMTTVFSPFAEIEPEEYRRATEVTYLGQVHGTMAALARMRARDQGHIINVGSALAFVGIPLQSAYCGAKFAVRGFTESVRAELLHDGSHVRISLVHLPAVNTPQFDWCRSKLPRHPQPVPPIYQPETAATAIVATLDGRRSSLLGSWNRMIVAATKLAPDLLQHFAARTGYSSQQTDDPVDQDRPSNLTVPVDDDDDHGAHGAFDGRAGGVLERSFLQSLPITALDLGRAGLDTVRDKVGRLRTRIEDERSHPWA